MKVINILMIIGQIGFVEPRTDLVRSKPRDFDVQLPQLTVKKVTEIKPKKSPKTSRERKNRRKLRNDTRNRKRLENRRRRNSRRRYRSRSFTRGDF